MNFRYILYILRDYILRNTIYLISIIVMTVLLITTISGFGFYQELQRYFINIPDNTYIYRYNESMRVFNEGRPSTNIPSDNTEILENKMNKIKERFPADIIERSEGTVEFNVTVNGEQYVFGAVDYGNSFLSNTQVKITEGRLPKKDETNALLLQSAYKQFFSLNEEIDADYEGTPVKLHVVGFYDNPYVFSQNLKIIMKTNSAIVFNPVLSDSTPLINKRSNTLLISSNTKFSEQEMREFMLENNESPQNFYKYDPVYEYSGEEYSTKKDYETLLRKMLISVAFLFALIFAESFFGMERLRNYLAISFKLGMSYRDTIINAMTLKGIILIIGMTAGVLIYRSRAGTSIVGGISISESYWSWKYALISIAVSFFICALGHLPYIAGIRKKQESREE